MDRSDLSATETMASNIPLPPAVPPKILISTAPSLLGTLERLPLEVRQKIYEQQFISTSPTHSDKNTTIERVALLVTSSAISAEARPVLFGNDLASCDLLISELFEPWYYELKYPREFDLCFSTIPGIPDSRSISFPFFESMLPQIKHLELAYYLHEGDDCPELDPLPRAERIKDVYDTYHESAGPVKLKAFLRHVSAKATRLESITITNCTPLPVLHMGTVIAMVEDFISYLLDSTSLRTIQVGYLREGPHTRCTMRRQPFHHLMAQTVQRKLDGADIHVDAGVGEGQRRARDNAAVLQFFSLRRKHDQGDKVGHVSV